MWSKFSLSIWVMKTSQSRALTRYGLKSLWSIHENKCRTFSDCSSGQNGIFSSRLSCVDSVLLKTVQKSQEVHQLSSSSSFNSAIYQFHHAREILWHCLLESSLAYSPAFVIALRPSVSNFYLPNCTVTAPRHPCLNAHSEFLMRNRCIILTVNKESSERCTQACNHNRRIS